MSKTGLMKTGTEQGARGRGAAKLRLASQLPPGESPGIHAAGLGARGKTLEPGQRGVRCAFSSLRQETVVDLSLRHDHGCRYRSHSFGFKLQGPGIQSEPGFVRAPAGHGAADQGIRTGKQQLLRTACCESVADRRLALQQWRYTAQWFVRRHGHRSPEQVLQVMFDFRVAA